jgi:hypothetical protein
MILNDKSNLVECNVPLVLPNQLVANLPFFQNQLMLCACSLLRASTLVSYDSSCYILTRNIWSTLELYNSLSCAYKESNIMSCMVTTTHTIVVKLSGGCFAHEVVASRGNDLFHSPCSLSSTSSKILRGTAGDDLWDCWRIPMYLL